MKRSRIKRSGKKTKAWDAERAKLKVRFAAVGITECELRLAGCWKTNTLGFAHSKKRRHIQGDEIREVALLCNSCHDVVERLAEAEMTEAIRKIISSREIQP